MPSNIDVKCEHCGRMVQDIVAHRNANLPCRVAHGKKLLRQIDRVLLNHKEATDE